MALTAFETCLVDGLPPGDVAEAVTARGLPTRRDEAWKWSDLRASVKTERSPSGPYHYEGTDVSPLLPEIAGMELVIGNGALRAPTALPVSIRVNKEAASPVLWPNWLVASLATASPLIDIEIGESLDAPLFIRRLSSGEGYHADLVRIHLAEGVSATIIETHKASDSPFANSLTHYTLSEGAALTRIIVQPPAPDAVLVHNADILVPEGASVFQMTLSGGGKLVRHETAATLSGQASVTLDGVYRLSGQNHCDMTSLVDHTAPGSVTRQLVKGVAEDRARAVFQGKFQVDRSAQQTDARMGHHAMLLNDGASVNAKPELEIYADDVECAHGNTVGALDPEALFYLRQRGLSEVAARRLLIDAFYAEVFDRLPNEDLRAALLAAMGDLA